MLAVAVVDLLLGAGLGLLFDLGFVALCVAAALLVRPRDFFTVGVLPPLLMLGLFVGLGSVAPSVVAHPGDGSIQAVVTGLASHAGALTIGYLLCLACLAMRQHVIRQRRGQASNRPGSPAPRRTNVGTLSE